MPTSCVYCRSENAEGALVCAACSRDIAIPATLIAELDDFVRKRDDGDYVTNCKVPCPWFESDVAPRFSRLHL
jgi:hypothetical protein